MSACADSLLAPPCRTYSFESNTAWVSHKGSVQLVSNNPEAEFMWVKAVWYQANVVGARTVMHAVVSSHLGFDDDNLMVHVSVAW